MMLSCGVLEEIGDYSDVSDGCMPAFAGVEFRGIVFRGMLTPGRCCLVVTTLMAVADVQDMQLIAPSKETTYRKSYVRI